MRRVLVLSLLVTLVAVAACGPKEVRNCCSKTPTVDNAESLSST